MLGRWRSGEMAISIKRSLIMVMCLLCASSSAYPTVLASVRGTVSHRISGCDYFLVKTSGGYDLLEWYSGQDPDKGDLIVGNYESYGFHDVLNETADESLNIYTEDFQLSKTSALEKLTEKCE